MITDKNFSDWHDDVFGYGYGSGEEHWIPALHDIFTIGLIDDRQYEAEDIQDLLSPLAAWLIINTLCGARIFEYGTSPRFGWLTSAGQMLREYIAAHSVEELADIATNTRDDNCMRGWCNCTNTVTPCNPLFREL